jgi:hypothetical protein
MSPFRNYGQIVPGRGRCGPYGRCVVCSSRAALICHEFAELVCQSWSAVEIDMLKKAARSALL